MGSEVEERLVEVVLRPSGHRIRPVAHQNDAGHRQRGKVFGDPGETTEQVRTGSGEFQFRSPFHPLCGVGETEQPGYELLAEQVPESGLLLVRSRPVGEGCEQGVTAAQTAVRIRDLHATRIVEENSHDILLRHHQRKHQLRPKQAEEDERDRGRARRAEQDSPLRSQPPPEPPVAEQGKHQRRDHDGRDPEDAPGHQQFDLPALERHRRAAEQPLECRKEHGQFAGNQ